MRIGALEAGGTKMVCAVTDEHGQIIKKESFPTGTPEETIPVLVSFFEKENIDALGIGCFGPIDLNPESKTYGYITTTPKIAWQNFDMVGTFKKALNVPIGFDTDVNGSALGEYTYGIAKETKSCVYITIGTGVGVGAIVDGHLIHGMMHPEGGHILLSRHPKDTAKSFCPFHENCMEGLAAGPAIELRYGKKAYELADCSEVWELEAHYIAQALVNYVMLLSPEMIILGGGVMHQEQLLPMVRKEFASLLNGYIKTERLQNLDDYIVLQSLNDNQGILGAAQLGINALG